MACVVSDCISQKSLKRLEKQDDTQPHSLRQPDSDPLQDWGHPPGESGHPQAGARPGPPPHGQVRG